MNHASHRSSHGWRLTHRDTSHSPRKYADCLQTLSLFFPHRSVWTQPATIAVAQRPTQSIETATLQYVFWSVITTMSSEVCHFPTSASTAGHTLAVLTVLFLALCRCRCFDSSCLVCMRLEVYSVVGSCQLRFTSKVLCLTLCLSSPACWKAIRSQTTCTVMSTQQMQRLAIHQSSSTTQCTLHQLGTQSKHRVLVFIADSWLIEWWVPTVGKFVRQKKDVQTLLLVFVAAANTGEKSLR